MDKNKDKEEKSLAIPETLREKLILMAEKNWDEFLLAYRELALGIWVEEKQFDNKGVLKMVRVYQQKPDKEALKYLQDQVIGKAKENMVVEGKVNFIMDT